MAACIQGGHFMRSSKIGYVETIKDLSGFQMTKQEETEEDPGEVW